MAPHWSARPARSSAPRCTSSPTSTSFLGLTRFDANRSPLRPKTPCLLRRLLQRRDARQDDLDARTIPRRGIEIETPAEPVGHDAVDDMKAEPGTALVPPGGEERIEGAAADIERHAAAIVGEDDLDVVLSGGARLDFDDPGPAIGKSVRHRIEEKIGQHLAVGTGIAVHAEIGLALHIERQIVLAQ